MTAGRPLEAVKQGLYEVGLEVGDKVIVCGAGTTGSGRYLTGDFIGADMAKNEITAHATAAANVNKNVDTIFEIGGQDSQVHTIGKRRYCGFCYEQGLCRRYGFVPGRTGRKAPA